MDDEEYAATLLAILTNPHPTGIEPADPYGTADDGIDRRDGFGRDVVVESADVVHGAHGPEVELGFRFVGSGTPAAPALGTVRLPVEREWRSRSGYDDPATYAPRVAVEVLLAATSLARSDTDSHHDEPIDVPPRAEQWRDLRRGLEHHGDVVEIALGHLEVRDERGAARFTVLVTPEQWEDVWGPDAWLLVDEILTTADADERFLVCYRDRLETSTRAALPPVRGRALEREVQALWDGTGDDVGWTAGPGS